MRRPKLARTLAAAALSLALASGCGDDKARPTVATPRVVSARDVAKYAPGTPQRALFEAIRALEYSNFARAAEFLAPRWRLTAEGLARRLTSVSSTGIGVPPISSARISGERARLALPVLSATQNVFMRRIGGRWKVERVVRAPGG